MSKQEDSARRFQFLQKYLNASRQESKNAYKKPAAKQSSDDTKKAEDWLTK